MKIVCFGDSLTRGVTVKNSRPKILKDNYPAVLQELLNNNKGRFLDSEVNVLNKGVFNDNSNLLLKRLEKDVLRENPSFVIIGIGGNDCNFQWERVAENPYEEHQATVPLDRYLKNIHSILGKVKEQGVTPILLTLPPLDPIRYYDTIIQKFSAQVSHWICKTGGIDYWHGKYNQHLTKAAEDLGILKIDVRSALKKAGDLSDLISADGIHLTSEGYKVLGTEVFRIISSLLSHDNAGVTSAPSN